MKVTITRTGGFAGLEERLAALDTGALPPAASDELRELVARLSAWCERNPESAGADRFRYAVEIGEPGVAARTLSVADEGEPSDPGVTLVRAVLALAGDGAGSPRPAR